MAAVDDDPAASPDWSLRCRVDLGLGGLATGFYQLRSFAPLATGGGETKILAMFCMRRAVLFLTKHHLRNDNI
ncbi:hypothetical protein E2562_007109 [Oryza meyeriana var. granulata]|uniref:Uncharacterized protein n=1 Tax=Oryza meyeriana var. granulata TaxID=110450 RepID=A0A6G1F526_9ORYZ|nr:hypothetical protein E2562_007109 [Oryza meyeriana var. granulata]